MHDQTFLFFIIQLYVPSNDLSTADFLVSDNLVMYIDNCVIIVQLNVSLVGHI